MSGDERFGERLRRWLANEWLDIKATDDAGLRDLADAIDLDAAHQLEWQASTEEDRIASALTLARQKVEQLVEELRYSASAPPRHRDDPLTRDVLDAEPLLERLAGIFAARPEGPECRRLDILFPAGKWVEEDGDVLWWRVPVVEPPFVGTPLDSEWERHGALDYPPTHFSFLPYNPEVSGGSVGAADTQPPT